MADNFSYWEQSSFFNYDAIIIGSGIVGLIAAIHLKKSSPNLNIAVLERGFLPSGASTKNAGFACFGSVSELIEQEKNKYCRRPTENYRKTLERIVEVALVIGR
jgi:L-2-hydroxyglutarate oxidase LhgO